MRRIEETTKFRKELKRYKNQIVKLRKIHAVILKLANGEEIPPEMKPHRLIGRFSGHMECHIENDLLLIWIETLDDGDEVVYLERVGTHSELFNK